MNRIRQATKNEVLGLLLIRNLTLKAFALQIGEEIRTVHQAVSRHCGTGRKPVGLKTKSILCKLEQFLYCNEDSDAA